MRLLPKDVIWERRFHKILQSQLRFSSSATSSSFFLWHSPASAMELHGAGERGVRKTLNSQSEFSPSVAHRWFCGNSLGLHVIKWLLVMMAMLNVQVGHSFSKIKKGIRLLMENLPMGIFSFCGEIDFQLGCWWISGCYSWSQFFILVCKEQGTIAGQIIFKCWPTPRFAGPLEFMPAAYLEGRFQCASPTTNVYVWLWPGWSCHTLPAVLPLKYGTNNNILVLQLLPSMLANYSRTYCTRRTSGQYSAFGRLYSCSVCWDS